jgi:hypothetical protein
MFVKLFKFLEYEKIRNGEERVEEGQDVILFGRMC